MDEPPAVYRRYRGVAIAVHETVWFAYGKDAQGATVKVLWGERGRLTVFEMAHIAYMVGSPSVERRAVQP